MDISLLRPATKSKYNGMYPIGHMFGNWRVIDDTVFVDGRGGTHLYVVCSLCENVRKVRELNDLKKSKQISGCFPCVGKIKTPRGASSRGKQKIGNKNPLWTGIGEISRSSICAIKASAKSRKLSFLLSDEYIWNLFLTQNRKCRFSGADLTFKTTARKSDGTASLDRIDSSIGYIEGNVQWVHKAVNIMKQNMTDEEFISWCKLVVTHANK